VKVVDFNVGPHTYFDHQGIKVSVAQEALEAEYLINVPVLKTHFQTRVSLGIKNLKGLINFTSKKSFHRHELEPMIAWLASQIKVDLTIIDGVYSTNRGPTSLEPVRADVLIAGKNLLETDLVGTALLSQDPANIPYLQMYAAHTGQSLDL